MLVRMSVINKGINARDEAEQKEMCTDGGEHVSTTIVETWIRSLKL